MLHVHYATLKLNFKEDLYMKRILIGIMVFIILVCNMVSAAAPKNITVNVDGKAISFPDAKPFINSDGRTMIPIRFVSEKMDASVTWNGINRVVTIKKDSLSIELKIGLKTAIVNNKEKNFDTAAIIKQSRTFVPLRFVSEALGAKVDWNGTTNTVNIYTKDYQPVSDKFIEPQLQIVDGESKYSPYYFVIKLENAKQYPMNAYMVKVNIDNYPQLNKTEQPNALYPGGWEEIQINNWTDIQTGIEDIWDLNKAYYTTRENKKTFKINDGMVINYTVSIKQVKTNIVKDYKGVVTVKLKQ